jgi:two-component system KDP operon response regulator KdpE
MAPTKILVVEDEPEMRQMLRLALVAHGYETLEARTGQEAVAAVKALAPGLVLLDLKLHPMGDLDTCRAIRAVSEVPIIVISQKRGENDKVDLLDAGADDYVVKPIGMEELLARMRAALRRAAATHQVPATVVLDDVTIDFKQRRVRRGGEVSALKFKEFELLHYLLLHAGDVIPHRRLLQAVWGPDYGDEVEYLRVIINRLRKKIEANPAQPRLIITEPKVGYSFVLPQASPGAKKQLRRSMRA